jgi:protein-disulfide isomerase
MRAIATFFTGLALCLTLAACQKGSSNTVTADDMSLGNPNAKVTVIEYASVSCPHCAKWNEDVWPDFKKKYIDTGRIHYVLREALTGEPSIAAAGFLTARCAGKDKYFQVVDAVYHNLQEMETSGQPRPVLERIAQSAGLSEQQFSDCVNDTKAQDALQKRWQTYMDRDKITGTPTFVINGKTHDGEMSLADIDAAIAAAEAGKPS